MKIFDVVLDSGLFHNFGLADRTRYAGSLSKVIRENGVLWITCLSDRESGDWGPHRVTEDEIRDTFSRGWTIEQLTICDRQVNRPVHRVWQSKAWLAKIRHTDAPRKQ